MQITDRKKLLRIDASLEIGLDILINQVQIPRTTVEIHPPVHDLQKRSAVVWFGGQFNFLTANDWQYDIPEGEKELQIFLKDLFNQYTFRPIIGVVRDPCFSQIYDVIAYLPFHSNYTEYLLQRLEKESKIKEKITMTRYR